MSQKKKDHKKTHSQNLHSKNPQDVEKNLPKDLNVSKPERDSENLEKDTIKKNFSDQNLEKSDEKGFMDGFWQNTENTYKVIGLSFSLLCIIGFWFFSFYVIPYQILPKRDSDVAEREEREKNEEKDKLKSDLDKKLVSENQTLKFEQNKNWDISMQFKDFESIKINLKDQYAPKTVENFVRLANRGYYNDTQIHRIVKKPDFALIQGGDKELGNGRGGRSAFYLNEEQKGEIEDELWLTRPEFSELENGESVIVNKPEFRNPDFYKNFNPQTGTVEHPKGLILMAKTSQPDSASSQFFITLDKTTLPAQYTVFGQVNSDSFAVLDKIKNQVNPSTTSGDGRPDKELKIQKVEILNKL